MAHDWFISVQYCLLGVIFLIESSVNGNRLNIKWAFSVPLDTTVYEKAIADADEIVTDNWTNFIRIYNNECQKYLENTKAAENHFPETKKKVDDAPKINLDTKQLDAAISKVDKLITKLKTAQDIINKIGIPF